ncbi:MAG: Eco57I restriction-modification methylase domain-containing protein, partial [Halobacteriaceae archaeon]
DERPILPNFSFKISTGDSIVHKAGGEKITLSAIDQTTNDEIRRGITNLRDAKTAYFNGELNDWTQYFDLNLDEDLTPEQAIEAKQRELILLHLNTQIEELEQQTSQATLDGSVNDTNASAEIEAQISQLKTARDQIENSEEELFLWEIAYPEVMGTGGFDVVIGNPPYVSSGEIIDQGINNKVLEEYEEDVIDSLREEYREDLQDYAIENHRITDLSGKSDLYVYFFLKGLELLDSGGTLSFVTSNSWLDVGFGERLKEYIVQDYDLKYIVSSEVQRSFEEADINTEITIINNNSETVLSGAARFTTYNTAYRNVTDPDTIWKTIYGTQGFVPNTYNEYPISIHETDIHRSIAIPHTTLWQLGGGKINDLRPENGSTINGGSDYNGEIPDSHQISNDLRRFPTYNKYTATADGRWDENPKWSVFVRAPTSFFEKINPHLTTTLGDVADVHLGLTSGLNSFFYLEPTDIEEWGIESEYLRPLMKSPTEITRYRVTKDDLTKHVLDVQEDLED